MPSVIIQKSNFVKTHDNKGNIEHEMGVRLLRTFVDLYNLHFGSEKIKCFNMKVSTNECQISF